MAGEPDSPESRGGEERNAVHYQISITGRQAGAFFFALLVALGLAFFFGMKTGAAARKGPDAVSRLAAVSDLPVPTVPPEGNEKRTSEVVREPKAPESEKKLGFEEKAKEREKAAPSPTPRPEPPKTERPQQGTTTSRPEPAAAPAPAAEAAKSAAKAEGPFFVQVLATKNPSAADELAKKLKSKGLPADVSVVPSKPGFFRVRVGPYSDRTRAEAAGKKIREAEKTIKQVTIGK